MYAACIVDAREHLVIDIADFHILLGEFGYRLALDDNNPVNRYYQGNYTYQRHRNQAKENINILARPIAEVVHPRRLISRYVKQNIHRATIMQQKLHHFATEKFYSGAV